MSDYPHRVTRASAGTGKTYSLAVWYLRLLAAGERPDAILGTTFTRKAAGEIAGRVVTRLAYAACDEKKRQQLADDLKLKRLSQKQVDGLLRKLTGALHRLQVSTLDSLFGRIARSFSLELGLPENVQVLALQDPQVARLRFEAIDRLLHDHETQVMLDLLRRLHHDEARRSITEAIDQIILNLYDLWQEARHPELWQPYDLGPEPGKDVFGQYLEQLEGLREHLPKTKTGKTNSNWEKAYQHLQASLLEQDVHALLSKGLVKPLADGSTSFHSQEIFDPWLSFLQGLLNLARQTILRSEALRTKATFDLLEKFDVHYRELKARHHIVTYDDLPRALNQSWSDDNDMMRDEIYFRLDGRLDHVLLDEFQDTSLLQWHTLEPICSEIVATAELDPKSSLGTRSFYCVGDVKQAIYGWRGGQAGIFDTIHEHLNLPSEADHQLTKSYRSSAIVLDFIDAFFESLTDNAVIREAKHDVIRQGVKHWCDRYTSHEAAFDLPGRVELRVMPSEQLQAEDFEDEQADEDGNEEDSRSIVATSPLIELARQLTQDHPQLTIGILTRTNKTAAHYLNELKLAGLNASGESGESIAEDPAVNVILAALSLADHPGSSAHGFHLLHSPLQPILGIQSIHPSELSRISRQIQQLIQRQGLTSTITQWAKAVATWSDPLQARRLTQLITLAAGFDSQHVIRLSEFVRSVQETAVASPESANIRVMTVHKSKGLEFDAVILPELTGALARVPNSAAYVYRSSPTGPVEAVYRATNAATRQLDEGLQYAYEQEQLRRLDDDLSAMYVAMTRAKHALYMLIPSLEYTDRGKLSTKGWSNLTQASMLRRQFTEYAPEDELENHVELLYASGDENWCQLVDKKKSEPSISRSVRTKAGKLKIVKGKARRGWTAVSPSNLEGGGIISGASILQPAQHVSAVMGSLVHHWFEQLDWLDTFDRVEEVMSFLRNQRDTLPKDWRDVDQAKVDESLARVEKALQSPAIWQILSTPADAPDTMLWKERAFAIRVDDRLMQGRIDRVHLIRQPDGARQAHIIDFKTDQLTATEVEQRAETYLPQLEAYQLAASKLLKLELSAISASLLFTAPALVHRVL